MSGDHDAYVEGVSTRKVDDLVKALGVDAGVSKSTVSRICAELDAQVGEFRGRRLDHTTFPYVFCDATDLKGRLLRKSPLPLSSSWPRPERRQDDRKRP